jgi:hypothetical protein
MAAYEGQAGIGRANIGQQTGRGIAEMQYGAGQDLAVGRTRVGEIQANQLQNFYRDQANLLEGMGAYQSDMIGGQASNLINMQNDAANRAATQATGLATGVSGLQTGLVNNQNAAYQGATRINAPSFDAGQALNAAAGGYDLYNQLVNAPRKGGYAPVYESKPINYGIAPAPRSIDAYQNTTNRRLQGLT